MIGVLAVTLETLLQIRLINHKHKGNTMARLRLTDITVDSLYQSYKHNGNVIWESTRSASFKTKNLEFVEAPNGYYDIYGSVEAIEALTNYWKQQAEKDSE